MSSVHYSMKGHMFEPISSPCLMSRVLPTFPMAPFPVWNVCGDGYGMNGHPPLPPPGADMCSVHSPPPPHKCIHRTLSLTQECTFLFSLKLLSGFLSPPILLSIARFISVLYFSPFRLLSWTPFFSPWIISQIPFFPRLLFQIRFCLSSFPLTVFFSHLESFSF